MTRYQGTLGYPIGAAVAWHSCRQSTTSLVGASLGYEDNAQYPGLVVGSLTADVSGN